MEKNLEFGFDNFKSKFLDCPIFYRTMYVHLNQRGIQFKLIKGLCFKSKLIKYEKKPNWKEPEAYSGFPFV